MKPKIALISVYDKDGLNDFAAGLVKHGIKIISTGNTYRHIESLGLPVTLIEDVTGFPEILDGRVKSLHPKIHGGILARRHITTDGEQLAEYGIDHIDLVVANLYPFSETVSNPDMSHDDVIEMIDIGGPAMIRGAAKNYRDVLVVTAPKQYVDILARLDSGNEFDIDFREKLASDAFAMTAQYDTEIQRYFTARSNDVSSPFPPNIIISGSDGKVLKYGENPHQKAVFYTDETYTGLSIARATQLHGAPLSYNNIMDGAAALEMVQSFEGPTAVAVKHANPSGLATAPTIFDAFVKVEAADPISIFGGIVACNRPIDKDTATKMARIFLEVVIAPHFDEEALEILRAKKNLRILQVGKGKADEGMSPIEPFLDLRRVPGGLLVQEADVTEKLITESWRVVTKTAPSEDLMKDIEFGWKSVKFIKSNAIALVKHESLIGVGPGQMNRVQSARIALEHAGDHAQNAILASDAFFPFSDVVQLAAQSAISAIVQPGGSIRDNESIEAADQHGIAMIFTGKRHFRH